jgi:hypothetical protein
MTSRSTNLNHKLAALLRDLSDRANDEDRLRTEDVLRSVSRLSHAIPSALGALHRTDRSVS